MYIYKTKLICFSIFVLISLTVNSLCVHDWHPKRPLILSSNVQQVLPLPVSACASSLLASPAQAWLRSVCRASLVCGFAHALLYSQADCAGTSPRSIPPQKVIFAQLLLTTILHQDESSSQIMPGRPWRATAESAGVRHTKLTLHGILGMLGSKCHWQICGFPHSLGNPD